MNTIYQEVGMDYDARVFPSIGPEVLKAVVVRIIHHCQTISLSSQHSNSSFIANVDVCRVSIMQIIC